MDINDPKIRAEMEAYEKALANATEVLREIPEFKVYIKHMEIMAEYTKEKLTTLKDYEDIKKLQSYYKVVMDFINYANYQNINEEANNKPDTE